MFELNARHYFLTYPHTDLEPSDYLEFCIPNLPTETTVAHYTIAREEHEDGSPHIHALLSFESKLRIRSPDFFNVVDYTGEERHPNIAVAPKTYATWLANHIRYCKKDGNFISSHPSDSRSKWGAITQFAKEATDAESFMQRVLDEDPRTGFIYYDQILRTYERLRPEPPMHQLYSRDSFQEPVALTTWALENLEV